MNESTPLTLLSAARQLFAQHGYDGASVRAITRAAGANLGAITYHFGSKQALYDAVLASMNEEIDQRLGVAMQGAGEPLERLERVVRALFDFFARNPEVPQLILHELASSRPLPSVLRQALGRRIDRLSSLIREGQESGSIRPGDPRFLALSVASQPLWISMARRPLQEGADINQTDPEARAQLVDSVVRFARAGLEAHARRRSDDDDES